MKVLKNKGTLALCAGLVLIGFTSRPADGAPILGAQLFYAGGPVAVQTLPVDSAYESELGIYDSTFTRLLFLVNDEPPDVSATFDPSAMGIAIGDELIFGIRVVSDGNREYFLGPRRRNPDRVIHGAIDVASGIVVSFEDFWDGGDRDYNDNIFQFVSGIGVTPESLLLFPSPPRSRSWRLVSAPSAWRAGAAPSGSTSSTSVLPRPTRSGGACCVRWFSPPAVLPPAGGRRPPDRFQCRGAVDDLHRAAAGKRQAPANALVPFAVST